MTTRVQRVLGRLPAHFVATRPGKSLPAVAGAIASAIEVLSTDMAGVRRAHRIGHASELSDLLLLAGLHGLTRDGMGLLFRRWEAVEASCSALEAAASGSDPEREAAAEALLSIWGLDGSPDGLGAFAPPRPSSDPPDLEAAALRLASAARRTLLYPELVERARERTLATVAQHREGNGTVLAVLRGAANALDLELDLGRNREVKAATLAGGRPVPFDTVVADDLFHSPDHFWHASYLKDRGPLIRPVDTLPPPNRVTVGVGSTLGEIASESGLSPEELIATAAALGMEVGDRDEVIGLASAVAVALASGLEPEEAPRGVLRLSGPSAAGEVARRAGVPVEELVARLEAVGVVGADASTPQSLLDLARALRRYGLAVEQVMRPALDVMGLEENPPRRVTYDQEDCAHGHRFTVLRRGFGRALIRAEVEGLEDLTVGPMLVNRDEGRGFGWFGRVGDGEVLLFQEEGGVLLDGLDVTDQAFSWSGACFADAKVRHRRDFVFPGPAVAEDRWSRTIVTAPVGALDRDAVYPHGGAPLEMPTVAVGATRMAFFVQVARLSSREGTPGAPLIRRVTPHSYIGFADQSVFSAVEASDPGAETYPSFLPPGFPVAAHVRVSWMEHEAYAVRLLVPARLSSLDEDGVPAADRLLASLERFRPAGVEVRVVVIDDRWVLGEGHLADEVGADPLSILKGGTALWPSPPEPA